MSDIGSLRKNSGSYTKDHYDMTLKNIHFHKVHSTAYQKMPPSACLFGLSRYSPIPALPCPGTLLSRHSPVPALSCPGTPLSRHSPPSRPSRRVHFTSAPLFGRRWSACIRHFRSCFSSDWQVRQKWLAGAETNDACRAALSSRDRWCCAGAGGVQVRPT